jgi:hypothetical protein
MKRRGAAQGSEGEFGKFSIPNPPMYSTIMSVTIMSPLRGSDVVSSNNSMGGLYLDIALCALCADMVFFVLKNISKPNRHFLTRRPHYRKYKPRITNRAEKNQKMLEMSGKL